jgi:hypothetical protein
MLSGSNDAAVPMHKVEDPDPTSHMIASLIVDTSLISLTRINSTYTPSRDTHLDSGVEMCNYHYDCYYYYYSQHRLADSSRKMPWISAYTLVVHGFMTNIKRSPA